MVPLCEPREEQFAHIEELEERLRRVESEALETPLGGVSLTADGMVKVGQYASALSESGFGALVRALGISIDYAMDVCDTELLVLSVNRLAAGRRDKVKVHAVDGQVVNITGPKVNAVPNRLLVANCRPHLEGATSIALAGPRLRITTTDKVPHEVLPGDIFEYGRELTNCAAGSAPLEVRSYAVRLVCRNGMVAHQDRGSYRRNPSRQLDLTKVMDDVREALAKSQPMGVLEQGLRLANDARVGDALPALQATLEKTFGAEGYQSRFSDLAEGTTWYEVHNIVTAAARMYTAAGRRSLEQMAGDMVEWFASGEYERGARWRRLRSAP